MQEDEEVLTAYRGAVAAWKSKPRSPPEMASPAHFASFMAAQQQMVDELAAELVFPPLHTSYPWRPLNTACGWELSVKLRDGVESSCRCSQEARGVGGTPSGRRNSQSPTEGAFVVVVCTIYSPQTAGGRRLHKRDNSEGTEHDILDPNNNIAETSRQPAPPEFPRALCR